MMCGKKELTHEQRRDLMRFEEERKVIDVRESYFLARCLSDLGGNPDHADWVFNRKEFRFERHEDGLPTMDKHGE